MCRGVKGLSRGGQRRASFEGALPWGKRQDPEGCHRSRARITQEQKNMEKQNNRFWGEGLATFFITIGTGSRFVLSGRWENTGVISVHKVRQMFCLCELTMAFSCAINKQGLIILWMSYINPTLPPSLLSSFSMMIRGGRGFYLTFLLSRSQHYLHTFYTRPGLDKITIACFKRKLKLVTPSWQWRSLIFSWPVPVNAL